MNAASTGSSAKYASAAIAAIVIEGNSVLFLKPTQFDLPIPSAYSGWRKGKEFARVPLLPVPL